MINAMPCHQCCRFSNWSTGVHWERRSATANLSTTIRDCGSVLYIIEVFQLHARQRKGVDAAGGIVRVSPCSP